MASITSSFDSGNITWVGRDDGDDPNHISLHVKEDPRSELEDTKHFQWFHFRAVQTAKGGEVRFSITNAGCVSFPQAWPGFDVCVSSDHKHWSRCPTTYEGGILAWDYDFGDNPCAWFAYFDPYSYERHQDLIASCAAVPHARVSSLGRTLDGREMDLVEVGTGACESQAPCLKVPVQSSICFEQVRSTRG